MYKGFIESIDDFCNRKREWKLVREEEITDSGTLPTSRDLAQKLKKSILVLDKPPGPTSHQITHWVKLLLEIEKAGHGGTLEPSLRVEKPQRVRSTSHWTRRCKKTN